MTARNDAVEIHAVHIGQRLQRIGDITARRRPASSTKGAHSPILDVVCHPSLSHHGTGDLVHERLAVELTPEPTVDERYHGQIADRTFRLPHLGHLRSMRSVVDGPVVHVPTMACAASTKARRCATTLDSTARRSDTVR